MTAGTHRGLDSSMEWCVRSFQVEACEDAWPVKKKGSTFELVRELDVVIHDLQYMYYDDRFQVIRRWLVLIVRRIVFFLLETKKKKQLRKECQLNDMWLRKNGSIKKEQIFACLL